MFRSLREYMYDAGYAIGYAIGRHLRTPGIQSVRVDDYIDALEAAETEAKLQADLDMIRHKVRTARVRETATLRTYVGLTRQDIALWDVSLRADAEDAGDDA